MDAQPFRSDNPAMRLTLSTAKLGELDDTRYYYSASCQSCLRKVRISLVRLRSQLGDDFPLGDVRPRLKCSTCGSRKIIVAFWTPEHNWQMHEDSFREPPV